MKTNTTLKDVPRGSFCWLRVHPNTRTGAVDPKRDAMISIVDQFPENRRTRIEYGHGRRQMLDDTTPVYFDPES